MDDFNARSLQVSRDEYCARLLNLLTPVVMEGIQSIFKEAVQLCQANGEMEKYLMTFQNLLTSIAKWNRNLIQKETERIIQRSQCTYLESLVTCVHVVQLKALTAVRVGQTAKKVDLQIPDLGDFIHKTYIHTARKVYTRVYLFEMGVPPLKAQKNQNDFEHIVRQCIMDAVRESIPVEKIIKVYMDELEDTVVEEVKEQIIETPAEEAATTRVSEHVIEGGGASTTAATSAVADETPVLTAPAVPAPAAALSFNDVDTAVTELGTFEQVNAPKTIERLEEISAMQNAKRKAEEAAEADVDALEISGSGEIDNEGANWDDAPLRFGDDIPLDALGGFENAAPVPAAPGAGELILDDIEILE